jgi:transposase
MRHELTDFEWAAIKPFLPNKPRGVPRVDDRRASKEVDVPVRAMISLVRFGIGFFI